MILLQLLVVVIFCCVHVFAGKLRFLDAIPRSRWLSFAGGISVAYIFIHVFPEIAHIQQSIGEDHPGAVAPQLQAYLIALLGLTLFYGLERLVKTHNTEPQENEEIPAVFWLHIITFAVYNGLIGYLLVHRQDPDFRGLTFYAIAMALHFLVNDFGLRQHHQHRYRRVGRWILSAAILCGWLIGISTQVSELLLHGLFAFLAGGTILNVMKEELPDERKSRFLPFVIGVLTFAVLALQH